MDTIYSINKNLTFSDDFISNAIIKSEFLLEKYKDIIEKINENKFIIEAPTSDLDPYYIIKSDKSDKIVLKASYIGKIVPIEEKGSDIVSNIYVKWAWSDTSLSKASKVNLVKIFKYFLDREPNENSPIFNQIYTAFMQSIIKVDERFFQVLLNALLHLMKHIFYILIKKDNITEIYLIKEVI
jgi:hypothetical protein